MNVTFTDEAIADVLDAITYLKERNPTAAENLDADITNCIERLAGGEFDGPHPVFDRVPSCEVGRFRRSASTTSGTVTSC